MGAPGKFARAEIDAKEQRRLLQLKRNVDETLRKLTREYHRIEGLNRELEHQAEMASSELERAKSELQSVHRDLKSHQRREASLMDFLFKGLKSPLSLIEHHIEKVSGNRGDGLRAFPPLNKIKEEVHRLRQIIDDLAAIEAVQLGTAQLRWEQVHLERVVSSVVAEHQQMAKRQGVMLNDIINGCLPLVRGDRVQLKMALNHLVDNAIAHSPCGGSVTILANGGPPKDWVRLSVVDMRREALDEISMRALQGVFPERKTLEADIEGFDLELMAAWQIVAMHKGEITVQSQADRGTVFTLALPRAVETGELH